MPKVSASSPKKRIAIFLDGTWNNTKSNTNVWRLAALCAGQGNDGVVQVTHYNVGVNGIAGGMLGKGVAANVVDAYEWLVGQYNPEDEISFSASVEEHLLHEAWRGSSQNMDC